MKRTAPYLSWTLLLCAAVVAGGQFLADAQPPDDEAPAAAKGSVAVLDVERVFKEHTDFLAQIEQMKLNVTAAENDFREEADKIKELSNELKTAESAELKSKLEAEIAERSLRLKLKIDLQKKDFMNREADIYLQVYRKIKQFVADYSRQRGISLVMRINHKDDVDKITEREEILAAVNRSIVFQDGVDITDEIIKRINSPVEGGDL